MNRREWLAHMAGVIGKTAAAAELVTLPRTSVADARGAAPIPLPRWSSRPELWLNSAPLRKEALQDRVVLVEFWTFGCRNCRNTLPWVKAVHTRHGPHGLTIVAVHTPEFEEERDPLRVAAAVRELGIEYPVLLDSDWAIWTALQNQYWPAFHLFDRGGVRTATAIGELHLGTPRAQAFERKIVAALGR